MAARASAAPARAPRRRTARPAPAPAPRRRPAAARPNRRARRRPRTVARPRGVWLWLPIATLLLGGIVWINVARLQLTRETSDVIQRSAVVDAQNTRMADRLERQRATIESSAANRLGMERAAEGEISFLPVPDMPQP